MRILTINILVGFVFSLSVVAQVAPPSSSSAPAAGSQPASSPAAGADVYPEFNKFCIEYFGAEKEELAYATFGRDLKFVDTGLWVYPSKYGACIGFQTNLPAMSYVEFGPTKDYGSKTDQPERHFYIHLAYLKNLKPDAEYHYRLVAIDERGRRTESPDATFRTGLEGEVIEIGRNAKFPFALSKAGAKYVLTTDVVADATAFDVQADDVTLDLGGHAVTYNNVAAPVAGTNAWDFVKKSAFGIRVYNFKGAKLLNGVIRQGLGADAAQPNSVGFSPVIVTQGSATVAGLTLDWIGAQITGLSTFYMKGDCELHHNVLIDRGTVITNRHQAAAAIRTARSTHHNLVKRCRQRGIEAGNGSELFANEIYGDSYATNSILLFMYNCKNVKCYGNKVFGGGYMAEAIATVSKTENIAVYDNFVHVQATRPNNRWPEYGAQSGVACARLTWGGKNIEYYNNVFVARARDGGKLRNLWVCAEPITTGVVYRDNILKGILDNQASTRIGTICIAGDGAADDAQIIFRGNTVISNFANVIFAEGYGTGNNTRFYDNKFVRTGDRKDYQTISCGWWVCDTYGHIFRDSVFEGGAGYDKVVFAGGPQKLSGKDSQGAFGKMNALRDFTVEWTLSLKTAPEAKVTVKDSTGREVFVGRADKDGKIDIPLAQYKQEGVGDSGESKKTDYTPHIVTVDVNGRTADKSITMDKKQELELKP